MGGGSIAATFEVVYQLNLDYSWMSSSHDTDLYLIGGGVALTATRLGNTFWAFDADKMVQTYYGDGSPYNGDFVTGSALYTGTLEAGQGFRFDLRVDSSIETTGANASINADVYVILRDVTVGFELMSASEASYLKASAVPEPSTYGMVGGLAVFGFVVGRRRRPRG